MNVNNLRTKYNFQITITIHSLSRYENQIPFGKGIKNVVKQRSRNALADFKSWRLKYKSKIRTKNLLNFCYGVKHFKFC